MPDDVMLTSVVCPVALAVTVIILVGALARYTLGGGAVQGFVSSASREGLDGDCAALTTTLVQIHTSSEYFCHKQKGAKQNSLA